MMYVVDDGADYRLLLGQVLNRFLPQCPVRFFADGSELRQHVQEDGEYPQVILLDMDMPVLNGLQTLSFLKQQPTWRHIPVVIMTSAGDKDDMEACYRAGASSFLIKPFNLEQMKQQMDVICQFWVRLNQLPTLT